MKKLIRTISVLIFFASFLYVCKMSELMNTGFTYEAAKHITLVEYHIIPVDAQYVALMED